MPSSTKETPSALRTWLQLLRAPNLFTVPGDPLAGYMIAAAGYYDPALWYAILASLCFYGGGLLVNDLADLQEDRRDRPARPLPSGAASPAAVLVAAAGLMALGLGALAFSGRHEALICGAVLVAAICLYNLLSKKWAVIGALNMGLCRGLSVMLGAFMGPDFGFKQAAPVALLFGLYIAAVTNLARHETRPQVPVLARLLPASVVWLLCAAAGYQALNSPEKSYVIPLLVVVGVMAAWLAIRLFRKPAPPLPPMIGVHIRLLLPLQAAVVWVADPWELGRVSAIVLLALWPVARIVSRWFYAS